MHIWQQRKSSVSCQKSEAFPSWESSHYVHSRVFSIHTSSNVIAERENSGFWRISMKILLICSSSVMVHCLLTSFTQWLSKRWACHCPWPLGEASGKPGSFTLGLLCPIFGGQSGSPYVLWNVTTSFVWLQKSHTILISVSRPFCTSFFFRQLSH